MHHKNIHLMGRLRSIHKNMIHHANQAKHVFGLGAAHKKMGVGMRKQKCISEDACCEGSGKKHRRLVPLKFKY